MSADHRAMRIVCQGFRDRKPTGPMTRTEIAVAAGATEGWLLPAIEELARTGYLWKGKRGSRAVYDRTDVERAVRPDLPDDWFYEVLVSMPGGERHESIVISTSTWHPSGMMHHLQPEIIEGIAVATMTVPRWIPNLGYGTKAGYDAERAWIKAEATRRGLEVLDGDVAVLAAAPPAPEYNPADRFNPYPSRPRAPETGTTTLKVWAPLADRPRAVALAQFQSDAAFKAYRENRR